MELLKVAEVSEALRLSRSATYGKIASGELPALRLGRGPKAPLRVPASELERFLRGALAENASIDAELDELRRAIRKAAP